MAYELEDGEIVILRDENVTDNTGRKVALILTNRQLIKTVAGTWSKAKETYRFPLTQLRESNGTPNILIGKGSDGKSRLELYFDNTQQVYHFKALLAEKKWASAIEKAYKAYIKEITKSEKEPISAGKIFAPVLGKIEAAKETLSQREQRILSSKCPFCGAIASGQKGDEVKCVYCEHTFVIK